MPRHAIPLSFALLLAATACVTEDGRGMGLGEDDCVGGKCEDPNGEGDAGGEGLESGLCEDGLMAADRIDLCRSSHPSAPWGSTRPGVEDPFNLLYYVNRWHSVDPCFANASNFLDGDSLTLAQKDWDFVVGLVGESRASQYGLRSSSRPTTESWTTCLQRDPPAFEHEIIPVPSPHASTDDLDGEKIRRDAWESLLPVTFSETGYGFYVEEEQITIQGFRALILAAQAEEQITITIDSGYRTAMQQDDLFFNTYHGNDPTSDAELFSARPLHSEHQLGTAADIDIGGLLDPKPEYLDVGYVPRRDYAHSDEVAWIRENAHRFGIVLSYPVDRVAEHQYVPEPWHYRYVGVESAQVMFECGLSTEEYLSGIYGTSVPELLPFGRMDDVYDNIEDVGYDERACWY